MSRRELEPDRMRYRFRGGQRHPEVSGGVPSGPIHNEYGMRALFDVAADLVDMELHG